MKRYVYIVILFFLLAPVVHAAVGGAGLRLNHGKGALTMQKGEKRFLAVQSGSTRLPQWKGLTYFSDNASVVSVKAHSGLLRANGVGIAHITVSSKSGASAQITVKVQRRKGGAQAGVITLLLGAATIMILYLILKKH